MHKRQSAHQPLGSHLINRFSPSFAEDKIAICVVLVGAS